MIFSRSTQSAVLLSGLIFGIVATTGCDSGGDNPHITEIDFCAKVMAAGKPFTGSVQFHVNIGSAPQSSNSRLPDPNAKLRGQPSSAPVVNYEKTVDANVKNGDFCQFFAVSGDSNPILQKGPSLSIFGRATANSDQESVGVQAGQWADYNAVEVRLSDSQTRLSHGKNDRALVVSAAFDFDNQNPETQAISVTQILRLMGNVLRSKHPGQKVHQQVHERVSGDDKSLGSPKSKPNRQDSEQASERNS